MADAHDVTKIVIRNRIIWLFVGEYTEQIIPFFILKVNINSQIFFLIWSLVTLFRRNK